MPGDADIAAVASLLAEPARVRVLLALADGRALPASVLAAEAGVAPSTASGHLRRLAEAGLVHVEAHGRHRYHRLAGEDVARLLEALAERAPARPVRSLREDTRAHALRRARLCYDHVAGRLGVALMAALLDRGVLVGGDGAFDPGGDGDDRLAAPGRDVDYRLTDEGGDELRELGIDVDALVAGRRPLVRYCVDWSEQRHHLAGALGAALAHRMLDQRWVRRVDRGRALLLTEEGELALSERLGVVLSDLRPAPVPAR
jgi:DNA-binding transcriptional ArsR family regulator